MTSAPLPISDSPFSQDAHSRKCGISTKPNWTKHTKASNWIKQYQIHRRIQQFELRLSQKLLQNQRAKLHNHDKYWHQLKQPNELHNYISYTRKKSSCTKLNVNQTTKPSLTSTITVSTPLIFNVIKLHEPYPLQPNTATASLKP